MFLPLCPTQAFQRFYHFSHPAESLQLLEVEEPGMDRHRLFAVAVLILTILVMAPVEVGAAGATNGQFCFLNIQSTFDPIPSNGYIITWNAAPGRTNYLTYADSLGAPWQDLVRILPTGPT